MYLVFMFLISFVLLFLDSFPNEGPPAISSVARDPAESDEAKKTAAGGCRQSRRRGQWRLDSNFPHVAFGVGRRRSRLPLSHARIDGVSRGFSLGPSSFASVRVMASTAPLVAL